jgi:hypothetical protein
MMIILESDCRQKYKFVRNHAYIFMKMGAVSIYISLTDRKCHLFNVRFEVFTAVTMKNGVFWDVTWYFFTACVGCYLQLVFFLVHRFLSP